MKLIPISKEHWDNSNLAPKYASEDILGNVNFQDGASKVTVHQNPGVSTTYHWCDPNTMAYQTTSGVVYHSGSGVQYAGPSGQLMHNADGSMHYQSPTGGMST